MVLADIMELQLVSTSTELVAAVETHHENVIELFPQFYDVLHIVPFKKREKIFHTTFIKYRSLQVIFS